MTRVRIPRDAGKVDASWLTRVLRDAGALARGRVRSFEAEPLGGSSFVGQLARLRLTLDEAPPDAPRRLVLKLPASGGRSRALGQASRGYERECRFYAEVAPHAAVPTPRVYASLFQPFPDERLDRVAKGALEWLPDALLEPLLRSLLAAATLPLRRYALLLEDVDARPGDLLDGCDPKTAERALATLARLHASHWQSEPAATDRSAVRLAQLDWLRALDETPRMFALLFRRGWPGFLERVPETVRRELERLRTWLEPNAHALLHALAQPPRTLCHGDYRPENLLFAPDGELVCVIDWQAVVCARGALDVAYFLGGALGESHGPEVERDLVRGYHRRLGEEGVRGYELERCHADYEAALLAVLYRLVIAFDSLEMDASERSRRLVEAWVTRLVQRAARVDLEATAERLRSPKRLGG